jgi:hypothetical protein
MLASRRSTSADSTSTDRLYCWLAIQLKASEAATYCLRAFIDTPLDSSDLDSAAGVLPIFVAIRSMASDICLSFGSILLRLASACLMTSSIRSCSAALRCWAPLPSDAPSACFSRMRWSMS